MVDYYYLFVDYNDIHNYITQKHLTLRKNKLDSFFLSKRKISSNSFLDNSKYYKIKIEELNIPNKYLIDIEQFVKNVNLKIILIL